MNVGEHSAPWDAGDFDCFGMFLRWVYTLPHQLRAWDFQLMGGAILIFLCPLERTDWVVPEPPCSRCQICQDHQSQQHLASRSE